MKHFKNCITVDQVKERYRQLAIKHHPDKNPGENTTEIMAEITAERDKIIKQIARKEGKTEDYVNQVIESMNQGKGTEAILNIANNLADEYLQGKDPNAPIDFKDIFSFAFGRITGGSPNAKQEPKKLDQGSDPGND